MDPAESSTIDVDARFLLANERTLLAWIRTGLAMLAGGAAVLQFFTDARARVLLGVGLLALGAATGVTGLLRYRAADRHLRRGELPRPSHAAELLAVAVVVVAIGLMVAYLVG